MGTFANASETIFAQDAVEHRLDGAPGDGTYPDDAGDMLSDFGGGRNLWEWRPGGPASGYYPNPTTAIREYYRHRRRCQVLWLDGHVSLIDESDGSDVPAAWYWGQPTRPI
jgi:prepilin-type processing-associated H-X9-DG protein